MDWGDSVVTDVSFLCRRISHSNCWWLKQGPPKHLVIENKKNYSIGNAHILEYRTMEKIQPKKKKKGNCNLYAVCNKDLNAFSIHIYYML